MGSQEAPRDNLAGRERHSQVTEAICRITEAFSLAPSEETLMAAVNQNLTGDPQADEKILKRADVILALWKESQKRSGS